MRGRVTLLCHVLCVWVVRACVQVRLRTNERAAALRDAVAVTTTTTTSRLPNNTKAGSGRASHHHNNNFFSFTRHVNKNEAAVAWRGRRCGVCGGTAGRMLPCSVADCPHAYHVLCAWCVVVVFFFLFFFCG